MVVHDANLHGVGSVRAVPSYLLALVAMVYIDHGAMTSGRITDSRPECLPTAGGWSATRTKVAVPTEKRRTGPEEDLSPLCSRPVFANDSIQGPPESASDLKLALMGWGPIMQSQKHEIARAPSIEVAMREGARHAENCLLGGSRP
jgi:hypothetical protein